MKRADFQFVLDAEIQRIRDVLEKKGVEYADEDQLFNFRRAAALKGCSLSQALAGMMVKHTVSIYDMVERGEQFPLEIWGEKITDHLNYLILLKAVLIEDEANAKERKLA